MLYELSDFFKSIYSFKMHNFGNDIEKFKFRIQLSFHLRFE